MHERMSSVIELRFDFNDRDPGDLEQINRLLATMELTDVDVKDIKGYLATTQEFQNDPLWTGQRHAHLQKGRRCADLSLSGRHRGL